MIETQVTTYKGQKAMQNGIKSMQRRGWAVTNTQAVQGKYKAGKTCLLALLFLPLALLGRGGESYMVTYQRGRA